MTNDEFEQQLRTWVRRQPFLPFAVVLLDGERVEVDSPEALAFDGGAAGFIEPDGVVRFFKSGQVREIVPTAASTPS
jgi:hypothetical protein